MPELPKTRRKLREAEYFLGRLTEHERDARLGREGFAFDLNAFLTAFRSVTMVWQHEDGSSYDARFNAWKTNLAKPDQDLLKFMNDQRVNVIHRDGTPDLQLEIEEFNFLFASSSASPANQPPIGWLMTMMNGFETATIGLRRHYFVIGGKKIAVVDLCARGIELLKDLVQ